ncbi:MAG: cysteine desulfurase [Actinomycetota bacterium]
MATVAERTGRPALDVERLRKDFPILDRTIHDRPLVYLDSAATSQKPRAVIEAIVDYYERHNANTHRSVHTLAEEATVAYEDARAKLASFVGAPSAESIVFNRGTTESINLVAYGWGRKFLREGDEIVLSELEHHSNIIPWQLVARDTGAVLRYVPVTEEGRLDLEEFDRLLGPNTRLVAISGMSNVLGTMPPLRRIADDAHAIGALVLVDGAQLVPHAPVDVRVLDCDFLTISGHKMLGPTASGGLYAKPELLEAMDPFLGGGEMIREVHRAESTWREIPWKFEAGTMNIAEEIGLAAAIDYLEPIGMEAVRAHEEDVAQYAIDRLVEIGARVFGPHDMSERGAEISFWFRDIHPHDLSQVLDQEGVAIRAGHHCTQILHRVLGVPATARASFYLYSTRDEVDALIAALHKAGELFA